MQGNQIEYIKWVVFIAVALIVWKLLSKFGVIGAQTTEEKQLEEIWNKNPELQKEADFKQAVTNQRNKLIDEIIIDIEACTEEAQLQEIWNNKVLFQADAKFRQAVTIQKKKLNEQK